MQRGFVLLFCFLSITGAAQKAAPEVNKNQKPKLIVGLVIDQMRPDYLERFAARFTEGGFKRLIRGGYKFENCQIPYVPTVTAAGHACLYTGSIPALHGIVGNDWVESDEAKRKYCVEDKGVVTIGSFTDDGQMSPRNMLANTFGDELKLASNFKSRVYSISLKDRASVIPGGQSGDAAYWLDDSTGNMISSSYYMQALPAWVKAFNERKLAQQYLQDAWEPLFPGPYSASVPNNRKFARSNSYDSSSAFPHRYSTANNTNFSSLRPTPFGNSFLREFAEKLISNEKLGKGPNTDMIAISFSSPDFITHRFGPQSAETEDCYLRLDRELEKLLLFLDRTIGRNEYSIFLSADHAAGYSAAYLADNNLPAGAVPGSRIARDVNLALETRYGVKDLLNNYFEYQLYFDRRKLDSAKIDRREAALFAAEQLVKKPEIVRAFSYLDFEKSLLPENIRQKFLNGYFPKRSGDVQFIMKPNFGDTQVKGAEHGTMYNYDTHIPLIFYGKGIKPGKSYKTVYMTDVAPTMSALLHIELPNANVGTILSEIFY